MMLDMEKEAKNEKKNSNNNGNKPAILNQVKSNRSEEHMKPDRMQWKHRWNERNKKITCTSKIML